MLEEDFIMRVIHEMVATLLKLIFHIDLGKNEELNFKDQETANAYQELLGLIHDGKINEAENKLLDVTGFPGYGSLQNGTYVL